MATFDDVTPHVGLDTCVQCRKRLARHDRIEEIHLVAGVGPNPHGHGQCLYVSSNKEAAHVSCAAPTLSFPFDDIRRKNLIVSTALDHLNARVPDYVCAGPCGKKLQRGDRVVRVILVEGMAIDPELSAPAAQCSEDYEIAHKDCANPQMTRGVII